MANKQHAHRATALRLRRGKVAGCGTSHLLTHNKRSSPCLVHVLEVGVYHQVYQFLE